MTAAIDREGRDGRRQPHLVWYADAGYDRRAECRIAIEADRQTNRQHRQADRMRAFRAKR
jgi:hypothetical protein